jgi:hypothetical protein
VSLLEIAPKRRLKTVKYTGLTNYANNALNLREKDLCSYPFGAFLEEM